MKIRSSLTAPVYVGMILIFTGLSSMLILKVNELSENPFLSLSVIQLFVFLIPTAFYCATGKVSFARSLKLKLNIDCLPLIFEAGIVFFSGAALIKYVGHFFLNDVYVDTPGVISTSVYGSNQILLIVCMGILPAFLEELVFRGILLDDYRAYGDVASIIMSSLFFAMIHFSLDNFLYYFLTGLIFGAVTIACDSCIPAMVIHALNNIVSVELQDNFIVYIEQLGTTGVFAFVMLCIFLIFLIFLFSRIERIHERKAENNASAMYIALINEAKAELEGAPEKKKHFLFGRAAENPIPVEDGEKLGIKEAVVSPTFLIVIIIFLIKAADFV